MRNRGGKGMTAARHVVDRSSISTGPDVRRESICHRVWEMNVRTAMR